jgi:hypothetical protein
MPPISDQQLIDACNRFFSAFSTDTPPLILLSYFSTTHPITIQHCPAKCPTPHTSILRGPNAVRSYFDLLATHWTRSNLTSHAVAVDPYSRRVIVKGSVNWTWKKSGRSWQEDFSCTLVFDDSDPLKIANFVVKTENGAKACVMQAVDVDTKRDRSRIEDGYEEGEVLGTFDPIEVLFHITVHSFPSLTLCCLGADVHVALTTSHIELGLGV